MTSPPGQDPAQWQRPGPTPRHGNPAPGGYVPPQPPPFSAPPYSPTTPSIGYPPTPPPQPPKKRNTTAIVLGIIGGVLVLCCGGGALAVALAPDSKPATPAAVNTAAAVAATAGPAGSKAPATTAAAAPKAAGLNTPVRDGKFEFTVTSVKYGVAQVGDSFLNKKAQGQFVEVSVTVKNIGNEARTFDGSNQRAYGDGGVKYEDDGTAEIYANSDDQTFLNDINPGNSVKGILIFDIPKGAKLTKIELHDSFFSGGVTVQLS